MESNYKVNLVVETHYSVLVAHDPTVMEESVEDVALDLFERAKVNPEAYACVVAQKYSTPVIDTPVKLHTNFFNSSVLLKGVYDEVNESLTLTMRSGKMYRYGRVKQACWEELIMAESAGQYFNDFIKVSF